MNEPDSAAAEARESFNRVLAELRPKLHRYCARMTGSVIDGEDVVQEAIMKSIEAFRESDSIANPEGWLFRIAHNTALDFIRRRAWRLAAHADEDLDMLVDPVNAADDRQLAAASLRTFMRLPVAQRSSVILMDVLGYSLQEIGEITDVSIPAVKAALHRGRAHLRDFAGEPDDRPLPELTQSQRSLFAAYVDRFNARDFDAIRDMLADEVRLELVAKARMNGRKEVGNYLHNYAGVSDWEFQVGTVEGRPAVLGLDPNAASRCPAYFVLREWEGERLLNIRDFRYARYAMEGAELHILGA